MQEGRKQKSPGNKVLALHRGSFSTPVFLMQAASVCMSASACNPLGGQRRVKRLEFGMSVQSHFNAVPSAFSLCCVFFFLPSCIIAVSQLKSQTFLGWVIMPYLLGKKTLFTTEGVLLSSH